MKEFDMTALIAACDKIADDIQRANVGSIQASGTTLKEKLHYELLMFAVFLVDADGNISENEIKTIRDILKTEVTQEKLIAIKRKEHIDYLDYNFKTKVPSSLKYAVLADAGKKLVPDPYKGQKAMMIYDCFKLFGQYIMAAQDNEADVVTMSNFTSYIEVLEKYLNSYAVWFPASQKSYTVIEPAVEDKESDEDKAKHLQELLEDLNSLTGLESVKHQVNSLVNLIRVQKMREEAGLVVSDVSKHMVFMGNPGTGKTTVARKLADIYKYLGVLKKGQLVEVDRGGLVRGYVGQTATRTSEVISEAFGGILFIDEAYTLTVGKGEGDFGQEAVDTLLKAMEDHRDELIVVVAGYNNLMEEFLASNPGLKSRFANYIFFDDYTAKEMMEILQNNLKKQQYKLSEEAEKRAMEMFEYRVEHKPENFANARDVRNFMEKAISNQATRIVTVENPDKDTLVTIEAEDLQNFE
ncbi:MAG: AAA family ATPase [Lachnospiraceae bacterium]|nr:AAA family ATPase [Lachnospiraceae bacterium]MCR4945911.1 AAA family ATPase [Lachnospiraceae bacterium]